MIHIALCFDNNFFKYGIVLIESIIKSNKNNKLSFHIIAENWTNDNHNILNELISQSGNNYKLYQIPSEITQKFDKELLSKYSIAYFGRFLIINMLDSNIDRILYLDADILVNGDLNQLYNIDMGEFLLAGVLDTFYIKYEKYKFDKLFNGKLDKYFNSGVLVMKTEYWRNIQNLKNYIDKVNEIAHDSQLLDQDALNILLKDNIMILPPKYNFFNGIADFPINYYTEFYDIELLKEAFDNPIIIHYSYKRPDHIYCFHSKRSYFWKYLKNSRFKILFNEQSFRDKLKLFIFSFGNPKERGWIVEQNKNFFNIFFQLYYITFFNSKLIQKLLKKVISK